jgi:hypothetical protein
MNTSYTAHINSKDAYNTFINMMFDDLRLRSVLYDADSLTDAIKFEVINNFSGRIDLTSEIKYTHELYMLEIHDITNKPIILVATSIQNFSQIRDIIKNAFGVTGDFKYNNKLISQYSNLKNLFVNNSTNKITFINSLQSDSDSEDDSEQSNDQFIPINNTLNEPKSLFGLFIHVLQYVLK